MGYCLDTKDAMEHWRDIGAILWDKRWILEGYWRDSMEYWMDNMGHCRNIMGHCRDGPGIPWDTGWILE